MAKYTADVKSICEFYAGVTEEATYAEIDDIIEEARTHIFNNFTIYDETYRAVLEHKILKHYFTREICEETVGLWKLRLAARMDEIMPYYNKLYQSELLSFNPLYDVDLNTSRTRNEDENREINTETKNNSTDERNSTNVSERTFDNKSNNEEKTSDIMDSNTISDNKNKVSTTGTAKTTDDKTKTQKDKYSDTPQGALNGVENDQYLTNARIISDESNNQQSSEQSEISTGTTEFNEKTGSVNTGNRTNVNEASGNDTSNDNTTTFGNVENTGTRKENGTINTTEGYLEHVYGKRGNQSYSSLLKEYRDTFINIDKMIIDELDDLFFGIWG